MRSVDLGRIKKAMSLFHAGSSPEEHILSTQFESLGSEVIVRAKVMESAHNKSSNSQSLKALARFFEHASLRFSDVLTRLNFIDEIQREFIEKDIKLFSPWYLWAALLIKDFHIDVISLIDSTSPIAIQGTIGLDHKDFKKPPGFVDLLPSIKRSYRKKMPESTIRVIDSTMGWYMDVKRVRDILAHRENVRIVFGLPSDGILFQVYESLYTPQILDVCFLLPNAKNVVDFHLYSAFIVAEILLFMEDLATEVMVSLRLAPGGLPKTYRIGPFSHLLDSLNRLGGSLGTSCPELQNT